MTIMCVPSHHRKKYHTSDVSSCRQMPANLTIIATAVGKDLVSICLRAQSPTAKPQAFVVVRCKATSDNLHMLSE